MCPCYSPSKVCYGLVTGSPELRHLLACLSEIPRISQGRDSKRKRTELKLEDNVNLCVNSGIHISQGHSAVTVCIKYSYWRYSYNMTGCN